MCCFCINTYETQSDFNIYWCWDHLWHTWRTAWPLPSQNSLTCNLSPWEEGCRGRESLSASWGREAHLYDCGVLCGGRDRIPPGLLAEDTLCSLLKVRAERVFFCFMMNTNKRSLWVMRRAVPLCLALVIISMCFMETLRSFCVMSDATSTWEKIIELNQLQIMYIYIEYFYINPLVSFVTFWMRRTNTAAKKRNVSLSSSTNASSSVMSLEKNNKFVSL